MEQERPVGDVLDEDAVELARGSGDRVDVVRVGREHRDVADLRPVLDADEVDRVEQAALLGDCRGERGERARRVWQVHAKRCAELRRGMRDASPQSDRPSVLVDVDVAAAGSAGSPGIVRTSPQKATSQPAPVYALHAADRQRVAAR